MRENSHAAKNCRASSAPPPHSLPRTRRITSISTIPWSSRTNWTRDAATASSRRYSSAAPSCTCVTPCPQTAATAVPGCSALSRRRSGRASTRCRSSRTWSTLRGPRRDGAGMISPRPDGGASRVPDPGACPWARDRAWNAGQPTTSASQLYVLVRKNMTKPVAASRNTEATISRPLLYWKRRDRRKETVVPHLKSEKQLLDDHNTDGGGGFSYPTNVPVRQYFHSKTLILYQGNEWELDSDDEEGGRIAAPADAGGREDRRSSVATRTYVEHFSHNHPPLTHLARLHPSPPPFLP